jgi:hypothetical protein
MDASDFTLIAVGCSDDVFALSHLGKKGTHHHPSPLPLLILTLALTLLSPTLILVRVRSRLTNQKREAHEMDALAEELLQPAPLDYDSDAAADEIQAGEYVVARDRNLGVRTCAEIFKNALENRTNSKRALKNHCLQAKAPSTQDSRTRWLNTFHAFMKTLDVP